MTPQPVEIAAADGCALRGQIWPGGADWIVLIHDVGPEEDLDRWRPLIPFLLAEHLSVLAVDLRGHGASDGEWGEVEGVRDIVATNRFARANGARFVAVVAAGASAAGVLWAAGQEALDGIVLLSATAAEGSTAVPRGLGTPKLFLVGANDFISRKTTGDLRRASIGWALTVTLPTDEHGTELLHGAWLGHVGEQVLGFVRERRSQTRSDGSGMRAAPADAFLARLGINPKGEGE